MVSKYLESLPLYTTSKKLTSLIHHVKTPSMFRFKANPEIREAIYSALCASPNSHGIREFAEEVLRGKEPEISMTDSQVSAVLKGIESAIASQSTDQGDWLRATEYMRAREYLIAETRNQFRVVRNP